MTFSPIIETQDRDIDCTLFRELQTFLGVNLNLGQPAAVQAARAFMTHYRAASGAVPAPKRARPADARFP